MFSFEPKPSFLLFLLKIRSNQNQLHRYDSKSGNEEGMVTMKFVLILLYFLTINCEADENYLENKHCENPEESEFKVFKVILKSSDTHVTFSSNTLLKQSVGQKLLINLTNINSETRKNSKCQEKLSSNCKCPFSKKRREMDNEFVTELEENDTDQGYIHHIGWPL